jgi:hypothetical protein
MFKPRKPWTPTILCAFCASLFNEQHETLKSTSHTVTFDMSGTHQSPGQFQEAVRAKCAMCLLRWNQLSSIEQGQVTQVAKRIDLSITIDLEEKRVGIAFAYRFEDGGVRTKSIVKDIDLVTDEGTGMTS